MSNDFNAASRSDQVTWKEKVCLWLGTTTGAWTAVLYWALFGWIGAVAVAGAETIIAALVVAYYLGGGGDA